MNGAAKVPAERSGLIPRFGSASLDDSLGGDDGLSTNIAVRRFPSRVATTGGMNMQIQPTEGLKRQKSRVKNKKTYGLYKYI